MIFVNDFVEDVISILDLNGRHVSGVAANITASVYDNVNGLASVPVVAEIGATGMYFIDFQPIAEGTWKVKWVCTSPIAQTSHRFIVRNAQDVVADQVWDELTAGHGAAGSFGLLVQNISLAIAALNDLSIADVQTALTNQGYTNVRAALLDNLDMAISGIAAAVDAVLSAAHGAGSWESAPCDYDTQPF